MINRRALLVGAGSLAAAAAVAPGLVPGPWARPLLGGGLEELALNELTIDRLAQVKWVDWARNVTRAEILLQVEQLYT